MVAETKCNTCGLGSDCRCFKANPGAQDAFLRSHDPFPAFVGGFGCIAPETMISESPAGDWAGGRVETLWGPASSTRAFLKGEADLYRVVTESGREVVVTLDHSFLSPTGWRRLRDLRVGDRIAASGIPHGGTETETAIGSQGRCCAGLHQGGVSPCRVAWAGPNKWLLPRMIAFGNSASFLLSCPLAKSGLSLHERHGRAFSPHGREDGGEYAQRQLRNPYQSPCTFLLQGSETRLQPSADGTSRGRQSFQSVSPVAAKHERRFPDVFQGALPQGAGYAALPIDQVRHYQCSCGDANWDCFPDRLPCSLSWHNYNTFWDKVVSIGFARRGDYYDLTVPGPGHYSANGLWHHNSGKTAAGCAKAFFYTIQNPGANGCITEPVSGMLADPLMEAWRKLWGDYEGSVWVECGRLGPNWRLEFPSLKSHILLRSAETPGRLIGFEVAWAWMDEAAESEGGSQELAFLNLVSRLRQKGFRHWLGITTTSAGRDWLWRDWEDDPKDGRVLFRASSYDNPHRDVESVERMAKVYGEGTPRYNQRIMAEFAQLEGLVLPTFDPNTMIAPWPKDELFLRKVAGVDFAPQSPTTIIETAITRSSRRWIREWLYKRECDDEALVRGCRDAMDDGVTLFLCDQSDPERIRWMVSKGIPAIKNASNKIERRVKAWQTPISQDRLTIDSGSPFTIREVMGLSWAKRRGREMETNRFDPLTPDHGFDGGANGLMALEKMVPKGMKAPDVRINL